MSRAYKFRNPDSIYFVTCTVVQWVDIFTREAYRQIVIDSLKFCQKNKGLVIHAYCLMTNHIHLIISRNGKETLSDIMRDFKKFTSKKITKTILDIPESRAGWMHWIFKSAGEYNANNTIFQFWIQDNHPVELSNYSMLCQRLNYLHNNPVKAGIVYHAKDYVYSSASAYAGHLEEAMLELEILEL